MKKILTLILVLAAVLSVSGVALAADVTLNIAEGPIEFTNSGYTQGSNSGSADNYIITGTATTANTITVNGGNPTITFSGLNITRNDSVSSGTPVLNVNSDAKIKLVGNNSFNSQKAQTNSNKIRHNVVNIGSGATLTVEDGGDGTLAITGAKQKPVIVGDGTLEIKGASVVVNIGAGAAGNTISTSGLVLDGGSLTLQATVDNGNVAVKVTTLTIKNGLLTANSKATDCVQTQDFSMSGGTLSLASGKNLVVSGTSSITGGNIITTTTLPDTDSNGRKLTKLHIVDANGEYKKAEPVPITTSSGTWDTVTDGNGVITTYLADDETVTGGQKVADGVWLVGGTCTCKTADISFADTVTEKDVYSNETVVDITVRGECKMPVHEDVIVSVAIESVTLEGSDTPVGNADTYATYADGKLTLKPAGNTTNYTVKLSAKRSESDTPVNHEIKAWASNTVSRKFNIANGPITVVGVEGTDNVTYKQGTDEYTVSKDTQVTITGEAAANSENLIKVDNCDPSFILHNVTVAPAGGSKSPILISGDSHAKIYISGTNKLVEHISGKAPSRDICGIELSSTDANNPAKVTIDCIEGSDCTDKSCPHKLYVYADLGAGIGARQNASSFFEVNIEGGHIIAHTGNYGTGIGSGWNSTAQFTVNIRDGFVEADGGDYGALIGYGRNAPESGVKINITGGAVDAKSTAGGNENDCCAIRGETITISGTDTEVKTDGSISAKTILVSGTAKLNVNEKIVPSGNELKFPAAVSGTVIVEASASFEVGVKQENSTIIVPTGKMESIVIGTDGMTTVPAGTVVEKPDGTTVTLPAGGTVDADGAVTTNGTVTVTDKDGNVTTITPPEGEDVVVNADGTVEVPAGSTVTKPDGTTITLPNGGTIGADGTVTADGAVEITDKDGNNTTITPPAGEYVTVNPDGTVEVPAGSTVNGTVLPGTGDVILPADKVDEVKPGTTEGTVVLPEGTVIENADGTTTLPAGGTVDAEGKITFDGAVITEKTDGSVTVTEGDAVTTITPPTGEDVTVNPDGTVEVPAGSTVTKPDGTTITLPNGGTIGADGTVTADGAVEITDKDGNNTTITPPEGEDVVVNADGTVEVPAGSTVTKPDGTTILPNGGTIGADGTITPNAHKIIEGANGIFNGQAEGLTFKSDADNENFESVKVDGNVVGATNYERTSGSTVITLKAAYLKTLTVGEHTLEIVSNTGTAATKFTIAQGAGVPVYTGGSSYSGPSIWYIGGNSFGTSTTQMPTSVEIDYVSVPFTMEGSNIVVSCINPDARWATVKWNSTSATINFNPDANVVCAQVVIPKTGDMPIWAAIAEFLGF